MTSRLVPPACNHTHKPPLQPSSLCHPTAKIASWPSQWMQCVNDKQVPRTQTIVDARIRGRQAGLPRLERRVSGQESRRFHGSATNADPRRAISRAARTRGLLGPFPSCGPSPLQLYLLFLDLLQERHGRNLNRIGHSSSQYGPLVHIRSLCLVAGDRRRASQKHPATYHHRV